MNKIISGMIFAVCFIAIVNACNDDRGPCGKRWTRQLVHSYDGSRRTIKNLNINENYNSNFRDYTTPNYESIEYSNQKAYGNHYAVASTASPIRGLRLKRWARQLPIHPYDASKKTGENININKHFNSVGGSTASNESSDTKVYGSGYPVSSSTAMSPERESRCKRSAGQLLVLPYDASEKTSENVNINENYNSRFRDYTTPNYESIGHSNQKEYDNVFPVTTNLPK